jgi:CRP-like cAMP-binding protein
MVNILNLLRQTDIFDGMTTTQLELAAGICTERAFSTGEIIFGEGETGDELFVVAQGEVEIFITPDMVYPDVSDAQEETIVTALKCGQSFGEMTLVDQGLRSATARATQKNTRVVVFQSNCLKQLCEEYPLFGYRLMFNVAADMASKMRTTTSLLRQELTRKKPGGYGV